MLFFPLWLLTDVRAGALQVAETGLLSPARGADVGPGVVCPSLPCALGGAPCCSGAVLSAWGGSVGSGLIIPAFGGKLSPGRCHSSRAAPH